MYLNPSTSPNNSHFKDKTLNSWLHWPRKPSRCGFCLVLPPHLPPSPLSPLLQPRWPSLVLSCTHSLFNCPSLCQNSLHQSSCSWLLLVHRPPAGRPAVTTHPPRARADAAGRELLDSCPGRQCGSVMGFNRGVCMEWSQGRGGDCAPHGPQDRSGRRRDLARELMRTQRGAQANTTITKKQTSKNFKCQKT